MNALKWTDVSEIGYVQFSIENGESFRVKTENVKRLAKYISEKKGKTSFAPWELDEVYEYVSKYIVTDIAEDTLKLISEKLQLFSNNGWKMSFGYRKWNMKQNFWNTEISANAWLDQHFPLNLPWIEKQISRLRFIWGILIFFWLFPAFGTMFMFDAPWSQSSNITNLLAGSIITYPIFVIVAWILSRILFHFTFYRSAFLISCIPIIDILWFVIMLYLSITVCGGQFACDY